MLIVNFISEVTPSYMAVLCHKVRTARLNTIVSGSPDTFRGTNRISNRLELNGHIVCESELQIR